MTVLSAHGYDFGDSMSSPEALRDVAPGVIVGVALSVIQAILAPLALSWQIVASLGIIVATAALWMIVAKRSPPKEALHFKRSFSRRKTPNFESEDEEVELVIPPDFDKDIADTVQEVLRNPLPKLTKRQLIASLRGRRKND